MKKIVWLLILLLTFSTALAYPFSTGDTEIINAKAYLQSIQAVDGSIDSLGTSNWATIAIWALDESSDAWANEGDSIEEYIETNVNSLDDNKATDWARSILSIVSMCRDPYMFGGEDHIATLKSFYTNNQLGDTALLNDDTYGLMALCAVGDCNSIEAENAKQFILNNQNIDGGWSWGVGQSSDPDSTAAAILALISAGESGLPITQGLTYIKTTQVESGGFDSGWGTNPNTDAMCVMAIDAAGQDPDDIIWESETGNSPVDSLLAFQDVDGGFTSYNKAYATVQAVPALLGEPYSNVNCGFVYANVRIQGSTNEVFSGSLIVDDHLTVVDEGGNPHDLLIPSALSALDKASKISSFSYNIVNGGFGLYVDSINGEVATGLDGWMYFVNHESPPVGMADYVVLEGDDILFYYGAWGIMETRIIVGDNFGVGDSFITTVEYYDEEWLALEGATIHFGATTKETDENGEVELTASTAGSFEVYASKEGFINSNGVTIKITGTGNPSQTLNVEAEIMPSVAFSVAPNSINFGQVGPGMVVPGEDISLINSGSWDILVTSTLSGSDPLFDSGLFLDNVLWSSLEKLISSDLEDFSLVVDIPSELDIPDDYQGLGAKTGIVTFWAQGIEP